MALTDKLERMENIGEVLGRFLDAEKVRGIMLVWEVVEDNWQMFKDRISSLFGSGESRSHAAEIVTKVKKLLAEKGKSLDDQQEEQIMLIAENIAGQSLDFTSYISIKNALHSRLSGRDGEAKSYEDPLTKEEFDGLVRALVLIIFNTFGNIARNLDQMKKSGAAVGAAFWNTPAKSIANVLSLPMWNVLMVQRPNLIRTLRYILFFLCKPYPGLLLLIQQNMKGSDEMHEALFTEYDPRREAKGVSDLGGDTDEFSVHALFTAERFQAKRDDIRQARAQSQKILQGMLGKAYESVRDQIEEITGPDALNKEPAILLKQCLTMLRERNIVPSTQIEDELRPLLTRLSGAAIGFALVPNTMKRAVKTVESGGVRGEGQDPDEPLTLAQIEGLMQNVAQVLFNTQLHSLQTLRSRSSTDDEINRKAISIANQFSRPRWRSVLAQAPEIIYFMRTAIGFFPRSFQKRIRVALQAKNGGSNDVDTVFFGDYPFDTVLQLAA